MIKHKKFKKVRKVSFVLEWGANQSMLSRFLLEADNRNGIKILSHKFKKSCDFFTRSYIKLTAETEEQFKTFIKEFIAVVKNDAWGVQWR